MTFCFACENEVQIENSNLQTSLIVTQPDFIRLGTKYNTLRGLTLSWQSKESDDMFRWGYTEDFEFGEYDVDRGDEYGRFLYHYTFPVLNPESIIYYSIKSAGVWREIRTFTSSKDTLSEQFSFIAGGDSHAGDSELVNERWGIVSEAIADEEFDFMIHLGDAVDDNDYWAQWETFYDYAEHLVEKRIIYYTRGNHEYGDVALYNTIVPGNKKWYSFTQGNALFICLLSEEDFTLQYTWFLDQLQNTDKEWIIVYFHRPFFTRGSHSDEMDDYRESWWKAFDDYGVDLVMSGHTHSYIRTYPLSLNISNTSPLEEYGSSASQGRLQFVSGGLGGVNSGPSEDWFTANAYGGMHYIKVEIDKNRLHFDMYSSFHSLIDSLTVYSQGTRYP